MPETVFTSLPQYLAASAIMVVSQAIYVLLGFGSGLIAVGSLALLIPEVKDVVVMLLLVNLPAEIVVVVGSRRDISWRGVAAITSGVLVGIPAGTAILRLGEPTFLLVLLGASLIGTGVAFARIPEQRTVRWPRWTKPIVGIASGVLTGLFGTGGPPLIVYYRLAGVAKAAFRGNLMAIFLLKTFIRVPSYAVGGLLTSARIWSAIALLPAVLIGTWLGNRVHVELSESAFRRLLPVALVAIGVVLLIRR